MKIGIFANINDRSIPIDILALALENRGIESLFVGEHTHTPVSTAPDSYHDGTIIDATKTFPAPFVLLTAAAAVTKRLRVGTSVCLPAQHNPLVFAKEIATLDMISGGRVELGCGYGWNVAELSNHGIEPRRRRVAFREALRAIDLLWKRDVAEFSGEFVTFSPSWSWPKPVQRPRPPILIGAPAKPAVIKDIIELSDGWIPSAFFADDQLSGQILELRHAAEQAGRDFEEINISMLESRAGMSQLSVAEFRDRCPTTDRLRRWEEMGIRRTIIGVPVDSVDETAAMLDHIAGLSAATSVS